MVGPDKQDVDLPNRAVRNEEGRAISHAESEDLLIVTAGANLSLLTL